MQYFTDYLEEMNVKGLIDGTTRYRKNPKEIYPQSAKINITKIQPAVGVKTITFFGEVPSFTREGAAGYTQTVFFSDVKFSDKQEGPEWKFVDAGNVKTWMELPSYTKNQCRVRCSCLDFRFRWMYADKLANSLYGNLIAYTKKTDREPLNPENIPGFCKHIFNMLRGLSQNGWVKE